MDRKSLGKTLRDHRDAGRSTRLLEREVGGSFKGRCLVHELSTEDPPPAPRHVMCLQISRHETHHTPMLAEWVLMVAGPHS